jgi:hypothetical protein
MKMAQFYVLNAAGNFHLRGKLFRSRWTVNKSTCGKEQQGQFSDRFRGHAVCEVGLTILLNLTTLYQLNNAFSVQLSTRKCLIHKRRLYLIGKINKTAIPLAMTKQLFRLHLVGKTNKLSFIYGPCHLDGRIISNRSLFGSGREHSIPRLRNKKWLVPEN